MQSSIPRVGHIASLDLLRGIAALSVCCFHLFNGEIFAHIPFVKFIFDRGYLGLDLFFLISGFIIPYSMYMNNYTLNKFPRFLLKRSCRIEPPYIISFILIILIRYIYYSFYEIDWQQFFLHFLYLNKHFGKDWYTIAYWTLAIEFQYYILIGLLFPLIFSKQKFIPLILFFACIFICWILKLSDTLFIFHYGAVFLSGILVFLYKIRHISFKSFLTLLSICFLEMYFKNGKMVICTTLFALLVILMLEKQWKLTNFLGLISFSLYLVHLEAWRWFVIYFSGYFSNMILLRITSFFFAIAFATLFYYLFERPAYNFSKRISYRNKSPQLAVPV